MLCGLVDDAIVGIVCSPPVFCFVFVFPFRLRFQHLLVVITVTTRERAGREPTFSRVDHEQTPAPTPDGSVDREMLARRRVDATPSNHKNISGVWRNCGWALRFRCRVGRGGVTTVLPLNERG